ncbi:unnamed protein product, partial [Chrysoparadoxa australica]
MQFIKTAADANKIHAGDLVITFEGGGGMNQVVVESDEDKEYQNRHGRFPHSSMVGKPFGCKVYAKNSSGFITCLPPTPELWTEALTTRTQIIQQSDQSLILFKLGIKPGDLVVESGTGSGAMSCSIMRAVHPDGMLHTFEFNQARTDTSRKEFEQLGLAHLCVVTHRDVCAERSEQGGFGEELDGKADAVLLDLPKPWLAVGHAKRALKPSKKLCAYSPCVEQVMKTCIALKEQGFHSITTVELREKCYSLSKMLVNTTDWGKEPAPDDSKVSVKKEGFENGADQKQMEGSSNTLEATVKLEEKEGKEGVVAKAEPIEGQVDAAKNEGGCAGKQGKKRRCQEQSGLGNSKHGKGSVCDKARSLQPRPEPNMRGHTAYLTFATR